MRLRNKVSIIVLIVWGLMFALAYVGSQRILQKSYLQLEQGQAYENIHRVYQAIEQMVEAVNTMDVNWAVWDDTYKFIEDKNQAYIDSNLPPASFASANVDIMLFYNSKGAAVFTEAVDAERTKSVPLPDKLNEYLDPKSKLVYMPDVDSGTSGFISIPSGIMLIAAHAIVTSENKGPPHGSLIMARYFTNDSLKTVSDVTKLNVKMYRTDEIQPGSDLAMLMSSLQDKPGNSWVKIINKNVLEGYKLLLDINDKPIALLEITMPRDVFRVGLATIYYYNSSLLGVGILLTLLLMYMLHKMVTKRLEKLNHEIVKVSESKEFAMKVTKTGNDEVSSVAHEINTMLDVIMAYDSKQKKLVQQISNELDQVNLYSKKLKDAEGLLRNVIEAMPSILAIIDNKFEINLLNSVALKSIDNTMENVKGKSLFDVFPYLKNYNKKFEDAIKHKVPQHISKIMATNQKENKTQYFNAIIYYFKMGQTELLTVRIDDITEYVGLEQTLTQNEKLAALGVLTAGVAHEINNPINFLSATIAPLKNNLQEMIDLLKGYSEIKSEQGCYSKLQEIEQKKKDMDLDLIITETLQLIDSIKEGANRTIAIVKDLKTFSRLDEDAMKKSDINAGIKSTLNLLKLQYKDRISIVTDYGDIPEVDCYPGKINQVFMNIISNAIDAIKGPGEIKIKTFQEKDQVVISIKDTGVGISEENKAKIFEPFFTTKEVGHGTGLGLSISFGIIRDHKGTIEVKSEVGRGSEFIIKIPIIQTDVKG